MTRRYLFLILLMLSLSGGRAFAQPEPPTDDPDLGEIEDGEDLGEIEDDEDLGEIEDDEDLGEIEEDEDLGEIEGDEDLGELDGDKDLGELDGDEDPIGDDSVGDVNIFYHPENIAKSGGSGQEFDEERLEAFEYDDIHSVLVQGVGVYVRQEDAFGLRPNIGIRGASSERSKKITLMEDGVLMAPAPYSAPAAYYFPLMTRMTAVEVFKGPGAIMYGPNTIGGAINMRTREAPDEAHGMIDAAFGQYLTGKGHAHLGIGDERYGILAEGVYLRSDGFKTIDGGGDAGFEKGEVMLRGHYNTDPEADTFHRIDLKLGYAHENSHETYLGLTDADFAVDSNRRYRASSRDLMQWNRIQAVLSYLVELDEFNVSTTLYRHDFWRTWEKFNGFRGGPDISAILEDPTSGARAVFYDVLTGAQDSSSDDETLIIGTNDRSFVSQGGQLVARHRRENKTWFNQAEVGLRVHHDAINRDHTEDGFLMQGGDLIAEGSPTVTAVRNRGETIAIAAHLLNQFSIWRVTLTAGLRFEYITGSLEDRQTGEEKKNDQVVFLPGAGLYFAITDTFGALAGVHRGFSPVAPGQPDAVEPEFSVNYEAGLRWLDEARDAHVEVIGFFNDYTNLSGDCSFAAGCDPALVDSQFNAGEVLVWGVESMAAYTARFSPDISMPLRLSYTYTGSAFQTGFQSDNPQYGEVSVDDSLPYIPPHQLSAQVGLDAYIAHLNISTTYVAPMREEASAGDEGPMTDTQVLLDAMISVDINEYVKVYLKGDNLLGTTPIASRRPFGARPVRPLLILGGVKAFF